MADLVERLRAYDPKASLIDRLREHDLSSYPEDDDWQDHYCDRADDLLKEAADRLTVLEAEAQENARLLGMGGEREAGLYGEIERLKRKVAALEAEASEGERRRLERVADLRVAIATALCGFVALGWDRREGPIRLLEQALADDKRRALIPEAPVREDE